MKNMKSLFLYVGMGSCISTKSCEKPPSHNNDINLNNIYNNNNNNNNNIDNKNNASTTPPLQKTVITSVQPSAWQVSGSKDEQFFDSKAWLESDDEDFVSVNGDWSSPPRQVKKNGEQQGRRLSDLFKESSFSSDSQTSLKAAAAGLTAPQQSNNQQKLLPKSSKKVVWVKQKSIKRCLPSLVRSLSCGDRKKRPNNNDVAIQV